MSVYNRHKLIQTIERICEKCYNNFNFYYKILYFNNIGYDRRKIIFIGGLNMSTNFQIWGNVFRDNSSMFGESTKRDFRNLECGSDDEDITIEKIMKIPVKDDMLLITTGVTEVCIASSNCTNMEVGLYGQCSSGEVKLEWIKEKNEIRVLDEIPNFSGKLKLNVILPNSLTLKYLYVNTKSGDITLPRYLRVENAVLNSKNGNIDVHTALKNEMQVVINNQSGNVTVHPINVRKMVDKVESFGEVRREKFTKQNSGYEFKVTVNNDQGTTFIKAN